MAANPPVPPRPVDLNPSAYFSPPPPPPTLPPLPPNFNPQQDQALDYQTSQPHFEDPLVAPRPHKLQPDLPAEMARTLDSQVARGDSFGSSQNYPVPPGPNYGAPPPSQAYGGPPPGGLNLNPGFAILGPSRGPSPLLPPAGSSWSPWNIPQTQSPPSQSQPLPPSTAPLVASRPHNQPQPSYSSPHPHQLFAGPPPSTSTPDTLAQNMGGLSIRPASPPSLTAPLPTISSLLAAQQAIQNPAGSPQSKLAWSRDVLSLVDRMYPPPEDAPPGPVQIADSELARLADIAIPIILQLTNSPQPPAEAVYLRATLAASGAYPHHVQANPRAAFRDYEKAARAGFFTAWFKLGRDYENFGDVGHAKDCFERGVKQNNESCLYRMGMAHLLGQLGLPANPEAALPLLQRAATLATVDIPQPAYIYGLLLLGEFAPASLPPHLLAPNDARRHLERAAYLHFAPAQYKLGHAYEFAAPPFPFDALLSVQYYSLASQQGEAEADMALSKWFLCGAEGAFDKDEALAYTFAEKAARRGLPSAEFAMGYYMEVGVGGPKDIDVSRKWYTRASQHGNTDATERLAALSQPAPQVLSRQEHDTLTDVTLVRKRTQARQRSDARGAPPPMPVAGGQQIIATVRQNSLMHRPPRNNSLPPIAAAPQAPQGHPPQNHTPQGQGYATGGPPPTQGYQSGAPPAAQGYPPSGAPPAQGGYPPSGAPPPSQGYPPSGAPPPAQGYAPSGPPPTQGYPAGPTPAQSYAQGHSGRQASGDLRQQQLYGGPTRASPHPQSQAVAQAQAGPSRQFANQPRYGLTDLGATPPPQGTPPLRAGARPRPSGGPPPPQPQQPPPQQQQAPPSGPEARPPPGKGPATFQEMGFQSSKLEDKDCVIM